MGYAAGASFMVAFTSSLEECAGGYYDYRTKLWRCPSVAEPEPKYKPVATCPGCGAPMTPRALVCGYCRRPNGN